MVSLTSKIKQKEPVILEEIKEEILGKMAVWNAPVTFSHILDLIDQDKYMGRSITYQAVIDLEKEGRVVEEVRDGERLFHVMPCRDTADESLYPRTIFKNNAFRVIQKTRYEYRFEEAQGKDAMGATVWEAMNWPEWSLLLCLSNEIAKLRG